MKHVLEIQGIKKNYGKKHVVKDITFSMESSQVIGLLGPNGAGKTTTFYMIVGFIKANSGIIKLDDKNITKLPMYERSREGISYLPQEPSIFRKLSVEDNIMLVLEEQSNLNKIEKIEKRDYILEEFGLTRIRKQPGYTLSGGERRRTEIARAISTNPKFLLLDEPFAGIDPKAIWDIKVVIKDLASKGIGILLTDHNVRDTLSITTCSHIINEGKILVSGTKEELLSSSLAQDIYFGSSFEDN